MPSDRRPALLAANSGRRTSNRASTSSEEIITMREIERDRVSRRGDRGDTLIEILVTIVILALVGVAILGAFGASISGSAEQRTLATTDTVLRDFAEITTSQLQSSSFYPCAELSGTATSSSQITYADYQGNNGIALTYQPPVGFSIAITSVEYLYKNTTFQSSGCDHTQDWPELITATATGPKGTDSSLTFLVSDLQYEGYASPTTTTSTTTTTIAGGKSMHVSSMSATTNNIFGIAWYATVTVSVADNNNAPLSGVVVWGVWHPFMLSIPFCVTNSSGSCQIYGGNLDFLTAYAQFGVSGLYKGGYSYNASADTPSPPVVGVNKP
jgi:type II secretory pathway pseudopilin PulG